MATEDTATEVDLKMATYKIREALREKFPSPEYVTLFEVPNSTGAVANRSADAIVMSCWPSRGLNLIGFEIKASRSDWLREMRDPAKAESICSYCDQWYLAVGDRSIIKDGELPETWGLMAPRGAKLAIVKEAPKLNPQPITRPFLAALLRRQHQGDEMEKELASVRYQSHSKGVTEGRRLQKEEDQRVIDRAIEDRDRAKKAVEDFEKASGLKIGNWEMPTDIGKAVHFVRQYGVGPLVREVEDLDTKVRYIKAFVDAAKEASRGLADRFKGD